MQLVTYACFFCLVHFLKNVTVRKILENMQSVCLKFHFMRTSSDGSPQAISSALVIISEQIAQGGSVTALSY